MNFHHWSLLSIKRILFRWNCSCLSSLIKYHIVVIEHESTFPSMIRSNVCEVDCMLLFNVDFLILHVRWVWVFCTWQKVCRNNQKQYSQCMSSHTYSIQISSKHEHLKFIQAPFMWWLQFPLRNPMFDLQVSILIKVSSRLKNLDLQSHGAGAEVH